MAQRRESARKSPTEEYLQRRAQIFDAAARVFHTKGYDSATLADIAQLSGTDTASIYYYFESKAEIFREAALDGFIDGVRAVCLIADTAISVEAKIREILIVIMETHEKHFPYTYMLIRQEVDIDRISEGDASWRASLTEWGGRFYDAVRGVVEDGIREGSLQSQLPPGVLAQTIIGLPSWTFRWFEPASEHYSGEQLGEAFAELALSGMRGPIPKRSSDSRSRDGKTVK